MLCRVLLHHIVYGTMTRIESLYMLSKDEFFFPNIFNLQLIESLDVEPMYMEDQLYTAMSLRSQLLNI